jgi:NAD(P)-dependent dehydrogenase (short-subunit alcohol dehydrogenase family)
MRRFILVTGASSGIGESACHALAAAGYDILAGVRQKSDADRLAALMNDKIHPILLDVTEDTSVSQAVKEAACLMGENSLVAIINNAGIAVSGPVLYVPVGVWRQQLEVNVLGVVRVTQAFFPLLSRATEKEDSHPRRIINIGSVSGLFASPFVGPYAASKYALEAISDSLRRELYMYDIQVVVIEAGNIATPIWSKAKEAPAYSGPEYDVLMEKRQSLLDQQMAKTLPLNVMDQLLLKTVQRKQVKVRYLIRRQPWKFNLIRWMPSKWADRLIHKVLRAKSGI